MSAIHDLFNIVTLFSVLTSVPTLIASVGLILATSSFISGLQLVKGTSVALEGKIHRFNGVSSIIIYTVLFILSMIQDGLSWTIIGWISGACVIALKVSIVRRRRRRTFKYVSWLGGTLTLIWLYVVYVHMPV